MNDEQRRRFERGARMRDFAETVKSSFPAGSRGARSAAHIAELVERVASLDAARATNIRAAREGTSGKNETRERLREWLSQISRTARAISLDDDALKNRFRLPGGNPNAQTLVSAARSFLAEAAPLKTQFVEYGMPSDFVEALTALIADFEGHATRQHTGVSARAATGAAIDAALDELDDEVARFDVIARNRFAKDPGSLAALQSARRFERAPRRRGAPAAPSTNPPGDTA